MDNTENEILTLDEAMELLHIGKNTIYKLLTSGELKSFKLGKVYKIPRSAIDNFIVKKMRGA